MPIKQLTRRPLKTTRQNAALQAENDEINNVMPLQKAEYEAKVAKYEADSPNIKKELAEYPASLKAYEDEQAQIKQRL